MKYNINIDGKDTEVDMTRNGYINYFGSKFKLSVSPINENEDQIIEYIKKDFPNLIHMSLYEGEIRFDCIDTWYCSEDHISELSTKFKENCFTLESVRLFDFKYKKVKYLQGVEVLD